MRLRAVRFFIADIGVVIHYNKMLRSLLKSMKLYDIKGFTLVLNHVVFISAVFKAENQKSSQFNVKMIDDLLQFKFPNHADAVLARGLLVKALKEAHP